MWDIEQIDEVAVVSFSTNSIGAQNEAFFIDLEETLDHLDTVLPGMPVVFTGNGPFFSVGLDLNVVGPLFAGSDPDTITGFFDRYRATTVRLFRLPRPTVAAVNGHAIAGGLITALACDFRIGARSEAARLGVNELAIGMPMPAVYVELIRHAVGTAAAVDLILSARLIDMEEAHRLGVLHEVVEPDALIEAAIRLARRVPSEAFVGYGYTKAALQHETLARIEGFAIDHDREIGAVIADPLMAVVRMRRFAEVTGG